MELSLARFHLLFTMLAVYLPKFSATIYLHGKMICRANVFWRIILFKEE